MRKCLVDIKDIEKDFEMRKVVNGVSFQIYEGEVVGIIGPNGAGKTTTLNIILGLEKQTKGKIAYWSKDYKSLIGAQLQSPPSFPDLSAIENLELFACFYRMKLSKDELTSLMRICALDNVQDTEVNKLSGGQQKRLSIASAIVHQPQLIFLDEPTAALDPRSRKEIHKMIKEIKSEGKTIVLTSHDMNEVSKIADRILFFYKGRIIAEGTTLELFDKYQKHDLEEIFLHITKEEFA